MPRKPRFFLPGVPQHIVQRGHSRNPVFFEKADYAMYLTGLGQAAERYDCAIHAYVLMTNHTHILATPRTERSVSRMMQFVGRHYVSYVNHKYGGSGSLWEGRYKASMVDEDCYLFACMRYIELNPVRASMVNAPGEYPWSSHHHNAFGRDDDLIIPHFLYQGLGETPWERQLAYRSLFEGHFDEETDQINLSWSSGTPLGSDRFRSKVEDRLGRKVGKMARGRPKAVPGEG